MVAKKMHFGLFAACALAGAAVCADAVSDSFESGTVGSADPNWGTAGVVSSDVKANLAAADSPLNLATTKSLAVTGTVQRTASLTPDSSNGVKVDMLVKLTAPDDALTPDSITDSDAQIAIAANTASNGEVPLYIYCDKGWCDLGVTRPVDSWARVSMLFDYGHKTAQVLVDGVICPSANGFADAAGTTANGSWYKFAQNSASGLTAVKVIGTTAIDDVAVATTSLANPEPCPGVTTSVTPSGGTAISVTANELAKWGKKATELTDAEKGGLAAGIAPGSDTQLKITKMEMGTSGATLTVPALTPKAGYVNTIVTTASAGTAPEPVEITSGATTVTVPVPAVNGDSAVKYTYQIKTVTK